MRIRLRLVRRSRFFAGARTGSLALALTIVIALCEACRIPADNCDDHIVTALRGNSPIVTPHARVWFSKVELSRRHAVRAAMQFELGIADMSALFGPTDVAPFTIDYFVSHDVRVPHTSTNRVFLSAEQVLTSASPYLHETAHAMLNQRAAAISGRLNQPRSHVPIWFDEGLCEHFSELTARDNRGAPSLVQSRARLNSQVRSQIRTEAGQQVLQFVAFVDGPFSLVDANESERRAFYFEAHSFMNYLAARIGVGGVLTIYDGTVRSGLFTTQFRLIASKAPPELRRAWLETIFTDRMDESVQ